MWIFPLFDIGSLTECAELLIKKTLRYLKNSNGLGHWLTGLFIIR